MLCPSDEDWSSQPTDRLLSRWARRLGRLLMPLGGCRWDSGGPWNPLLLAQLHPFHPYPQPPPPNQRGWSMPTSVLSTHISILYFSPIHLGSLGHTAHQGVLRHQNPVAQKL